VISHIWTEPNMRRWIIISMKDDWKACSGLSRSLMARDPI